MNTKMLIATAAVTLTAALGTVSTAQADPHFGFSINFGSPGFDHGYGFDHGHGFGGWDHDRRPFEEEHFYHHPRPDYGDYNPPVFAPPPVVIHYGIGCGTGVNIVRGSGFQSVQAVDCAGPVYVYEAWKRGQIFDVSVNTRGQIIRIIPVY